MNLLAGLTVKGLSYACLALGIALVVAIGGWTMHASNLNAKLAAANTTVGRESTNTDAAVSANTDWRKLAESANAELKACNARETQEAIDARALVSQAKRADADAALKLAEFDARWNNRSLHCGTALIDMQRACESEFPSY